MHFERPDALHGVQREHRNGKLHGQVRPESIRRLVWRPPGPAAARRRPGGMDVPGPAGRLHGCRSHPGGQRILLLPVPVRTALTACSLRRFTHGDGDGRTQPTRFQQRAQSAPGDRPSRPRRRWRTRSRSKLRFRRPSPGFRLRSPFRCPCCLRRSILPRSLRIPTARPHRRPPTPLPSRR